MALENIDDSIRIGTAYSRGLGEVQPGEERAKRQLELFSAPQEHSSGPNSIPHIDGTVRTAFSKDLLQV